MDLAQLLGHEYILRLECDKPESLCQHMVRFVQTKHFAERVKLNPPFVREVLKQATAICKGFDNVICVNRFRSLENNYTGRITVVGDLHGQYRDLEHLLSDDGPVGLPTPTNQVIFNGDMIDRGDMSIEIILLLCLFVVLEPGSVYMLKGNHEASPHLFDNFGFCEELKSKYPRNVHMRKEFIQLFEALPVAAVVDGAVFVVHGGLGKKNHSIEQINQHSRSLIQQELNHPLYELIWNDPSPTKDGMSPNVRGEAFGHSITSAFLAGNNLKLLVRSHQHCDQGYQKLHQDLCITVFSAANYCDYDRNLGAVLRFANLSDTEPQIVQFEGHHYLKPAGVPGTKRTYEIVYTPGSAQRMKLLLGGGILQRFELN